MNYHPVLGISIFIISIIFAYYLGRKIIKNKFLKSNDGSVSNAKKRQKPPPKGEITSPDAPWLND